MGSSTSNLLSGALLLTAGFYQFTPLKRVCLRHCRTPLGFLMTEWRDGASGALVTGLRHGLFCLGCCWALMLVMFAAGLVDLRWMAVLAAVMIYEKVGRHGRRLTPVVGVVMLSLAVLLVTEWLPASALGLG